MTCHFCSEQGLYVCRWKAPALERTRADQLRVGDKLAGPDNTTREVIYHAVSGPLVWMAILTNGVKQEGNASASILFPRRTNGMCGNRVCYGCMREPDEGLFHCRDHWNIGEKLPHVNEALARWADEEPERFNRRRAHA